MSEQRKEMRKKLLAFTPVYDSKQKTLLGYVGDLTLAGVMVVGERSVESGFDTLLKIEFPTDLPDVTAAHIFISARTAWCRQDVGSAQTFNIGFQFIDINPEHTKIIHGILGRYQFRNNYPAPAE